jgi:hypothetical protein
VADVEPIAVASVSVGVLLTAPTMGGDTWIFWLALMCLGGAAGALVPYWHPLLTDPWQYVLAMLTGMLTSVAAAAVAWSLWSQEGYSICAAVVGGFVGPRAVADPEILTRMLAATMQAWKGKGK